MASFSIFLGFVVFDYVHRWFSVEDSDIGSKENATGDVMYCKRTQMVRGWLVGTFGLVWACTATPTTMDAAAAVDANAMRDSAAEDVDALVFEEDAALPASVELNLMSFNIRYGTADDGANAWSQRDALVYDVMRGRAGAADIGWDVIAVQEALAFQLLMIDAAIPALARIGVGRDDGLMAGEFTAIYYLSERFEVLEEGTFWLSDTPSVPGSQSWGNDIPRICTWGRFRDVDADQSFWVYNVHLDHRSALSRERAAELITEQMAARSALDEPVMLMGDFNAGEGSRPIQYLIGNRERATPPDDRRVVPSPALRIAFRAVYPDETQTGTFNGFTGYRDGAMIDYVLVGSVPQVEVLDAAIDIRDVEGRYPSDHFPVTARVRLMP